jgi:hypothetical protein
MSKKVTADECQAHLFGAARHHRRAEVWSDGSRLREPRPIGLCRRCAVAGFLDATGKEMPPPKSLVQ